MKITGNCYFAKNFPGEDCSHLIIVVASREDRLLVVPISSIKFTETGIMKHEGRRCKYYDNSCVFHEEELILNPGKFILNKPSFIRYQWAKDIFVETMKEKLSLQKYELKGKISKEILERIKEGAKISKEIEPRFVEFFLQRE